jgi:hypothetical protein
MSLTILSGGRLINSILSTFRNADYTIYNLQSAITQRKQQRLHIYAFPHACYTSAHSLAAVMARDVGKPTVPALTAKERSCASCAGPVDSGLAY